MSKKHLIIKDADEDIEYDVEEVTESEEPEVEEAAKEEVIEEEHKEEVCPECGKDPCECESAPEAAVFTEEEIGALKELISIVPELKKLLEAKPDEQPAEEEKVEEQEEIKEIEEIEEPKEDESEDIEEDEDEEEFEEDSCDSVTDSVGSLEQTVGDGKADESDSHEATMAERFKKYYGGN